MRRLYGLCYDFIMIQKVRRVVSYSAFFGISAFLNFWYCDKYVRAGHSTANKFYAIYPIGTELLTDTTRLYKAALSNCFENEDWGPIEYSIMAKHFNRQGNSAYEYHAQYMAHLLSHGELDGSG